MEKSCQTCKYRFGYKSMDSKEFNELCKRLFGKESKTKNDDPELILACALNQQIIPLRTLNRTNDSIGCKEWEEK